MTRFLPCLLLLMLYLGITQPDLNAQSVTGDNRDFAAGGKEDLALRDRCAKHFVMPDGTMKALISSGSLHYKDVMGRWQDIDCSLQTSSLPGYVAENTTNTITSYFPSDAKSGVKISAAAGEIKTGITPALNAMDAKGRLLAQLQKASATQAISTGNTVTYNNLFPNADNTYGIGRDHVKNNLVLTAAPVNLPQGSAFFAYSELVQLPARWSLAGAAGHITGEAMLKGEVHILNKDGQVVFTIPVPDVFEQNNPANTIHADGNWEYTYKVKNLGQGSYELSTLVPVAWLTDQMRNYPVVIDPTVTLAGDYGGWMNTGGSALDGNPTSFVFTGLNTNTFTYHGYIRFDLGSIPGFTVVTDTRLKVNMNGSGNLGVTETVLINDITGTYGPYGGYNAAVYNDLGDGNYTSFACTGTGTYGFFDLGAVADTHVMNKNMSTDQFQVGLSIASPTTWKRFTSNLSELEVTYIPCTFSVNATATSPTYPNGFNIGCYGDTNGSIGTSVTGGTSYTYQWTGPNGFSSTADSLTNLAAGTYYLSVYDAGDPCPDTLSITLVEPAELIISDTISSFPWGTNISCNGANDGSITLDVTGSSGYTYSWTGPGTYTSTAQNPAALAGGTYYVTVTEGGNSCTVSDSFTLTEPTAVSATVSVDSNVTCNGIGNGGLTVSPASGGTAPYDYTWSNGDTNTFITGVAAGTYTVTVTDANGCTYSGSDTVTEPTVLSAGVSTDSNVSCNGLADGGLSASATGGTVAYNYAWNTGSSTASIAALPAGNYTVTVTDGNGCTSITTGSVTEPAVLAAGISTDSNVSCNSLADGGLSASASGGTASYNYMWNTGSSSTSVAALPAGNYTVTVTDANGCTDMASAAITEPAVLAALTTLDNNVGCNGGSDGGATASATGGTTAYTYLWTGGATTAAATNLTAGTNTVTVTDANGCTATSSVTVTEPTMLTVSATVDSDALCAGSTDGAATASASGGTAVYGYTWSNSATTASITGLGAGTYTVTVTDNNGCTETDMVTITEPTALSVNISVDNNATCNGSADGALTVTASGGTTSYGYAWSNGGTSASVTGLAAGGYTATVTDANSCTATTSATITEPSLLTVSTAADNNVSCNGGSDGGATANASGGISPYGYLWSNGEATAPATNLQAGTSTVTVTDNNGCTATNTVAITEPGALSAVVIVDSNVTCYGYTNGGATASAFGGTAPYLFIWNNSAITATVTGLAAGTYTVTVTDNNGCTTTDTATVSTPALLLATIDSVQDVTCAGDSNGSAYASGSGGVLPYAYTWSNGSTTDEATGLAEGYVLLTVTDAHGCMDTAYDTILHTFELPLLDLGPDIDTNISVVIVQAQAGFASYTWNTGADSATLVATQSGTYTLSVTDTVGCKNSDSIAINLWPAGVGGPETRAMVMVYPNPNRGLITVETPGLEGIQLQWSVYTLTGALVNAGTFNPAATFVRGNIDLRGTAAGTYLLKVSSGETAVTTKIIIE